MVTGIIEKGWRVALPVALASVGVWIAHKSNWPEPDVLRPWLGTATVAGLLGFAITVVSFVSWLLSTISVAIRRSRERRKRRTAALEEYEATFREICDRVAVMMPFERERFLDLVRTETKPRFLIYDGDGPSMSLIGPLIHSIESNTYGTICEFHPAIQFDRQRILDHFAGSTPP